jgi:hypothetical protein
MKRNKITQYALIGLTALSIGMVSGCATTDTASSRFPALQENINSAKAADAETYASEPLNLAEAKLDAAKLAVKSKDMVSANKLIDEAMTDADYARALALTEKAKNDALKLREAIQVVRDEIENMPTVN